MPFSIGPETVGLATSAAAAVPVAPASVATSAASSIPLIIVSPPARFLESRPG
jgi:hypothetical protein